MSGVQGFLVYGDRYLIAMWNRFLAFWCGQALKQKYTLGEISGVEITIVTRKDKFQSSLDAERIKERFSQHSPKWVVFDPFGVGEAPSEGARYQAGLELAYRFDLAPLTQQVVWTCLEKKELPLLPNSQVIAQGMNLGEVLELLQEGASN